MPPVDHDCSLRDIVVAMINDEATVKYFYREGDMIKLQPANPYMAPIFVRPADVQIQGVVIGLVRKYKS